MAHNLRFIGKISEKRLQRYR